MLAANTDFQDVHDTRFYPPAIARHERAGGGQVKYLLAYEQRQRKKDNPER